MTEEQQLLYNLMVKDCADSTTLVIPFDNDDVPKYLENLRRFEEESKKVKIVIG
jgi:hypothetical protein